MKVMLPEKDVVTATAKCKHAPDLDTACTKQLTYTEVEEMCTYLEINASREPLLIPLDRQLDFCDSMQTSDQDSELTVRL